MNKKTDALKFEDMAKGDVFVAPLSAFIEMQDWYKNPTEPEMVINCPENCIEIEKENEYGWKNKVYIPKDILCKK